MTHQHVGKGGFEALLKRFFSTGELLVFIFQNQLVLFTLAILT